MTKPPNTPEEDWISKIIDDIYKIGVTDATLKVDDYPTLKPGIEKAIKQKISDAIETGIPIFLTKKDVANGVSTAGVEYYLNQLRQTIRNKLLGGKDE